MFPQAKTVNEALEKTRKHNTGLELQKELLAQIEERKRRDEEERRSRKMQDILDEERIRRENEEYERAYSIKHTKLEPRNLNVSLFTTKGKGGRFGGAGELSTIDEYRHQLTLEDIRRQKTQNSEFFIELQKEIKKAVANELKELKLGCSSTQEEFSDELSSLKVHVSPPFLVNLMDM